MSDQAQRSTHQTRQTQHTIRDQRDSRSSASSEVDVEVQTQTRRHTFSAHNADGDSIYESTVVREAGASFSGRQDLEAQREISLLAGSARSNATSTAGQSPFNSLCLEHELRLRTPSPLLNAQQQAHSATSGRSSSTSSAPIAIPGRSPSNARNPGWGDTHESNDADNIPATPPRHQPFTRKEDAVIRRRSSSGFVSRKSSTPRSNSATKVGADKERKPINAGKNTVKKKAQDRRKRNRTQQRVQLHFDGFETTSTSVAAAFEMLHVDHSGKDGMDSSYDRSASNASADDTPWLSGLKAGIRAAQRRVTNQEACHALQNEAKLNIRPRRLRGPVSTGSERDDDLDRFRYKRIPASLRDDLLSRSRDDIEDDAASLQRRLQERLKTGAAGCFTFQEQLQWVDDMEDIIASLDLLTRPDGFDEDSIGTLKPRISAARTWASLARPLVQSWQQLSREPVPSAGLPLLDNLLPLLRSICLVTMSWDADDKWVGKTRRSSQGSAEIAPGTLVIVQLHNATASQALPLSATFFCNSSAASCDVINDECTSGVMMCLLPDKAEGVLSFDNSHFQLRVAHSASSPKSGAGAGPMLSHLKSTFDERLDILADNGNSRVKAMVEHLSFLASYACRTYAAVFGNFAALPTRMSDVLQKAQRYTDKRLGTPSDVHMAVTKTLAPVSKVEDFTAAADVMAEMGLLPMLPVLRFLCSVPVFAASCLIEPVIQRARSCSADSQRYPSQHRLRGSLDELRQALAIGCTTRDIYDTINQSIGSTLAGLRPQPGRSNGASKCHTANVGPEQLSQLCEAIRSNIDSTLESGFQAMLVLHQQLQQTTLSLELTEEVAARTLVECWHDMLRLSSSMRDGELIAMQRIVAEIGGWIGQQSSVRSPQIAQRLDEYRALIEDPNKSSLDEVCRKLREEALSFGKQMHIMLGFVRTHVLPCATTTCFSYSPKSVDRIRANIERLGYRDAPVELCEDAPHEWDQIFVSQEVREDNLQQVASSLQAALNRLPWCDQKPISWSRPPVLALTSLGSGLDISRSASTPSSLDASLVAVETPPETSRTGSTSDLPSTNDQDGTLLYIFWPRTVDFDSSLGNSKQRAADNDADFEEFIDVVNGQTPTYVIDSNRSHLETFNESLDDLLSHLNRAISFLVGFLKAATERIKGAPSRSVLPPIYHTLFELTQAVVKACPVLASHGDTLITLTRMYATYVDKEFKQTGGFVFPQTLTKGLQFLRFVSSPLVAGSLARADFASHSETVRKCTQQLRQWRDDFYERLRATRRANADGTQHTIINGIAMVSGVYSGQGPDHRRPRSDLDRSPSLADIDALMAKGFYWSCFGRFLSIEEKDCVGRVVDSTELQVSGGPGRADSLEGTTINFNWARGKFIARGAYGRVFLAKNLVDQTTIVVKERECLGRSESQLAAWRQSVAAEWLQVADIHHENVMRFYGVEFVPGVGRLFMEYCSRKTLYHYYQEQEMEEQTIKWFTMQILQGLDALHQHQIAHRDIKPYNILLDANFTPKIGDFGSCSKFSPDPEVAKQYERYYIQTRGTLLYHPPDEDALTMARFGDRMDVWALGCVVVELLTGLLPYQEYASHGAEFIFYNLGKGHIPHPAIPPDCPTDFSSFLKLCFCRESSIRPTAKQLLYDPLFHYVSRPMFD